MCDVLPAGKGWNASLIVTLRHLPSFSRDACFSSKPSFRYTSSRTLKITQPSGSTTRTSSASASGGAWLVVKTPTETAAEKELVSKPRGSPNTMRCRPWYASFSPAFSSIRSEMSILRDLRSRARAGSFRTGRCLRRHPARSPEWEIAPHGASRHGGYRVAQALHVVFVIFRPLVVTARQLAIVAGRVHVL